MLENGMSVRMLDVLMRGISTRQYAEVLPEMASTCGVSKSNVSRDTFVSRFGHFPKFPYFRPSVT
jgi:hypothetical protein